MPEKLENPYLKPLAKPRPTVSQSEYLPAICVFAIWIGCLLVCLATSWFAPNVLHCQLSGAGPIPCNVLGVDIGNALSFLSLGLGLLFAFGAPLFIIAFVFFLVVGIVRSGRKGTN